MVESDYLVAAYTDIGRAIVAWALFEQDIISLTWRYRDPTHSKSFPQGKIEPGFHLRWLDWCKCYQAPQNLRESVKALSGIRDDLSHNITNISPSQVGYALGGYRRYFDWRTKYERWASKYAHLHWRGKPSMPPDKQPVEYYPQDIANFQKEVLKANAEVREVSEAWLVGRGYALLYMPPIQPWAYSQELDPRWERQRGP
jgi:hypothetical protein